MRNPAQHIFISNWLSRRKTRGFIFTENTQFYLCWFSRKERTNSRENSFSCIVALRFLLLVPRKEGVRGSWACLYIGHVVRVAFDNHVRLQAGARAATRTSNAMPLCFQESFFFVFLGTASFKLHKYHSIENVFLMQKYFSGEGFETNNRDSNYNWTNLSFLQLNFSIFTRSPTQLIPPIPNQWCLR